MDPQTTNVLIAASFRTPVTTCVWGVVVPEQCRMWFRGNCLIDYIPPQYGWICTTDLFPQ